MTDHAGGVFYGTGEWQMSLAFDFRDSWYNVNRTFEIAWHCIDGILPVSRR